MKGAVILRLLLRVIVMPEGCKVNIPGASFSAFNIHTSRESLFSSAVLGGRIREPLFEPGRLLVNRYPIREPGDPKPEPVLEGLEFLESSLTRVSLEPTLEPVAGLPLLATDSSRIRASGVPIFEPLVAGLGAPAAWSPRILVPGLPMWEPVFAGLDDLLPRSS